MCLRLTKITLIGRTAVRLIVSTSLRGKWAALPKAHERTTSSATRSSWGGGCLDRVASDRIIPTAGRVDSRPREAPGALQPLGPDNAGVESRADPESESPVGDPGGYPKTGIQRFHPFRTRPELARARIRLDALSRLAGQKGVLQGGLEQSRSGGPSSRALPAPPGRLRLQRGAECQYAA